MSQVLFENRQGRGDKTDKLYVWTFVTTCEPCGDSNEKMGALVEAMMKLQRKL
jgi:hypothetical protein